MPRIPFRRRRTLKERIADKLHETTEQLTEKAELFGEALVEKAEKAEHAASEAADKAAHQRAHLKKESAHFVSDLNSQAADRVRNIKAHSPEVDSEKLMKEAREVANNAAAVALDFWEKARSRTESAAHAAPTKEQISHQLGLAAQQIEQRSREAQEAAKKRAEAAKKSAADAKGRVKELEPAVEEKLAVAKERTGEIAGETADAGKNFGALLFGLAAAAGIIYFIILDKDRREKVLNTSKAVGGEAMEVVRDIRGHDGEFA